MQSSDKQPLRVVIQHLPGPSLYVLIVYDGRTGTAFVPLQYGSLQDVLKALRAAGISLRQQDLAIKDAPEPYIVFTGNFALDAAQLSLLGLKRQA